MAALVTRKVSYMDVENKSTIIAEAIKNTPTSYKDSNIIVGVSPFSSHFTFENILEVCIWTKNNSNDFKLFIPDEPTVFSLRSLGYEEDAAFKKATKQCRYLKNKCVKALQSIDRHMSFVDIVDYSFLNRNDFFKRNLNSLISLYSKDQTFSSKCDDFSASFLLKKNLSPSKEAIRFSSMYLIYELPLFINANQIFDIENSFFMYPTCPSFVKDILTGKLDVGQEISQDFLEYKIRK